MAKTECELRARQKRMEQGSMKQAETAGKLAIVEAMFEAHPELELDLGLVGPEAIGDIIRAVAQVPAATNPWVGPYDDPASIHNRQR